MDIRTALKEGIAQLRTANVDSFTLAAELLLLHVLGQSRAWLYGHPEEALPEGDEQLFFALIARRAAGEPTQHLTGKQEFWGLEFEVTPDVLIPRPETEHVVEVVLDRLALRELRAGRKQVLTGDGIIIIDVGTGSGCIAVALAKELHAARVIASDISEAALAVARRNATRHAVVDRMQFMEASLLERSSEWPLADDARGKQGASGEQNRPGLRLFDVIASNPPYIGRKERDTLAREVREHEPELALYGGEEGYEIYADLIAQAAQKLMPGGILVLELGHNSLPAVQPLLETSTWTHVGVTNDLAGIPRVIAAERT